MIKLKSNFRKQLPRWCAAIGILGLITYPIIISPLLYPSKYREIQKINREGIDQEKIQPGNMKVWSDPFNRKKPNTNDQ